MRFEEVFYDAQWVTSDPQHQCPVIRQTFELSAAAEAASINICGLGFFELYINGHKVSDDLFTPAHSDYCERHFTLNSGEFTEQLRHRVYFLTYDITSYLRRGKNALCVLLAPGWYSQSIPVAEGDLRYGDVRLAYAADIATADGARTQLRSGPQLRWLPGPITGYNLFKGEEYDYRGFDEGCLCPDYDDGALPRCQPLPDMDTDYQPQDCPADKVIRRIKPRDLGGGIYDAGENITGTPVLIARGQSGEVVEVRFSEELDSEGRLHEKYMYGQHARFVLDGKPRELKARFTWYGFRYFEVSGPAEVADIQVTHTDIPVTSHFESDNAALNWLYSAYVRTQLCNIHAGIPSDCPHIERRGYTGDGQLVCRSAMTVLGAHDFYRKWLRDIEDCQDDVTGHVQYTAPYTQCGGGPGGWGCAIVHVPYAYWQFYGDIEPAQRMLPRMIKYLDYLDAHSENDLVTSDNPMQWCLGDWCTPDAIAIPAPFVNNYFYIRSVDEILQIARALGKPEYEKPLLARREARANALIREYFDGATGDFAGNIQGANAFAIDIGLGDERTFRNMCARYEATGEYDTGIFGTDIVTRVLFERGKAQTAFALMASQKPASYDAMRRKGGTTLWEYWPVAKERSHSHPMFGGPVEYLFKYLLGIDRAGCGSAHMVVRPQLVDGLNYLEGHVTLDWGRLGVRINRSGAGWAIKICADRPENVVFSWNGEDTPLTSSETCIVIDSDGNMHAADQAAMDRLP